MDTIAIPRYARRCFTRWNSFNWSVGKKTTNQITLKIYWLLTNAGKWIIYWPMPTKPNPSRGAGLYRRQLPRQLLTITVTVRRHARSVVDAGRPSNWIDVVDSSIYRPSPCEELRSRTLSRYIGLIEWWQPEWCYMYVSDEETVFI